MKFFKRFIVVTVISAFAMIAGSVSSDYSCGCGEALLPSSVTSNISGKEGKGITDNTYNHDTDENFSMFGGVALAQGKKSRLKATFIELGSVNCIPCKMMKPVMKQIGDKYGDQVKVLFYDVWTKKGEPYGRKYGIRAIPTQVYLDSSGKEFFRHTGFHPFEEVEKILKKQGVR